MALNIEQRLGQKLTNEQQIIWNYIISRWTNNIVIVPVFYYGALVGSEFDTYAATKMYFCYELLVSYVGSAGSPQILQLFNEGNVNHLSLSNSIVVYDGLALAYVRNSNTVKNFLTSRMNALWGSVNIQFTGYRLTI